jgi:DNA primase
VAIPAEEVAQVRAATDIVGLIGEHVALKKQGRRWSGLCPFHSEKTPSFSVNAEEGLFYCFGCQKSGDAISFVREVQGMDFVDSVRLLADRAGITLHEDADGPDRKDRAQILDAMEKAVDFYHQRLLTNPDAGAARSYLRSRGYDGELIKAFRLGWAPDEWDALSQHLKVNEKILEGAGLGFVNKASRQQDFLRARVVFPICDPASRAIAIGGRILPPLPGSPPPERHEPKYKNSPETAIYSKRRTLYGLNWAKKNIIESGEIIVCEGYTDVIAFFQAGMPRAVATCGTALGEEHFSLMRNFAKKIILAYDADAAGQSATGRVYEWESKHEVDVAVCELPAGTDPAELGRSDPEALKAAVKDAKPFLKFRVDRALSLADLESPEGRAKAAEGALAAVAEHPDALVRDQYVISIADRCRLDPQLVRERLQAHVAGERSAPEPKGRRRSEEPPPRDEPQDGDDESVAPASAIVDRPGLEALRIAVHYPELVVNRLEPFFFLDSDQRGAFEALLSSTSLAEAIESSSTRASALLRRVAVEEPMIDPESEIDQVSPVISQLLRGAARKALVDLQADLRQGSVEVAEGSRQVALAHAALEELDDPDSGSAAEATLVAWLSSRGAQNET